MRGMIRNRTTRAGQPDETAELAKLHEQMMARYGIEMPIKAVCDALHAHLKELRMEAAAHRGDGPDGGDLDDRANFVEGVYTQLLAAYTLSVGG